MKKMFKLSLIVSLFGILAFVGYTYGFQVKASEAAALNPGRDLSVSFGKKHGTSGQGFVVGTVTNKSANTYTCVSIKFRLIGKNSRHLGFLSTEVKNIRPGSAVRYKEKLPYLAGFGLESISVCRSGSSGQPGDSNVSDVAASQETNCTILVTITGTYKKYADVIGVYESVSGKRGKFLFKRSVKTIRDHRKTIRDHRQGREAFPIYQSKFTLAPGKYFIVASGGKGYGVR